MPSTKVVYYKENDGTCPMHLWLIEQKKQNPQNYARTIARIQMLREQGHELRRPIADILRDGIYELRFKEGRIQHRILYFFNGANLAVLSHHLTKERNVPPVEIAHAIERRDKFKEAPPIHTYIIEENSDEENV